MLHATQVMLLSKNYTSVVDRVQKDILTAAKEGKKAVFYDFDTNPLIVNLFKDETPEMKSPVKEYFEAFGYSVCTYINVGISWYSWNDDNGLLFDGNGKPYLPKNFKIID